MQNDLPFYSHKQCMIDRYGKSLFRVPIDSGFSCPNRTPDGEGGCTFCPDDGVRSQQITGCDSIEEQVAKGVDFARTRYHAEGFMAYVQSFTATHADTGTQAALYDRLLRAHPFDAISVATRPDCLDAESLELLLSLSSRLDVWVELGVQTCHDHSLVRIRRGHTWKCSRRAIQELHARGIFVVAHVMIGLPGETSDDFNRTADALAALPVTALKLHNLHVVRGTALAEQYQRHPFPVFEEDEYAGYVIDFVRRCRPDVAIMRLNTDTPAKQLLAPDWALSKSAFREYVIRRMRTEGVRQGDRVIGVAS